MVRCTERANHHIQLLTRAIDKKPPRGLIPKISPKIPVTPGKFIKWEGIQQETGLNLTQALREYWIDISHKLSEELNKATLETSSTQWTKIQEIINISRETTQEIIGRKAPLK